MPNELIDSWDGYISFNRDYNVDLSVRNFVLRGSTLRNSEFAIGLVVFVGKDTKIYQFQSKIQKKKSWIVKKMNYMVFQLFCVLLLITVCLLLSQVVLTRNLTFENYLTILANGEPGPLGIQTSFEMFGWFMQNLMACNNLIPISIYILIHTLRLLQFRRI
jgi:magnesium-transporting ATPase (P-type)